VTENGAEFKRGCTAMMMMVDDDDDDDECTDCPSI
jgi:hypothetical protein